MTTTRDLVRLDSFVSAVCVGDFVFLVAAAAVVHYSPAAA